MTVPSPAADARVLAVHRYPVKSTSGEALPAAVVDARGLVGDRTWAVRDADGRLGSGKSTRRFRRMPGLLDLAARLGDDGVPVLALPDGRHLRADDPAVHDVVSAHVGRPVTLAPESDVSHFDDGPVHLLTTSTLRALEAAHGEPLDPRRFRPNLVLATDAEGYVEDDWTGREVALGDAVVLRVTALMPRCVMVNLAQCDGVRADGGVLQAATDAHAGSVGVVAEVVRPGRVAVGDPVRVLG
jgi:uncharacterized protein YcbX